MASPEWIKRKRQQVEEYLEAQMILGLISKDEAQKEYERIVKELKVIDDKDIKSVTLDSL